MEFAILCSKKEFCKNSSLITRNVVSCCNVGCYSVDSPYTTRHPTHHPKPCILLRMWILRTRFALALLVTLKKVTSELTLQLILYQIDMLCEGDEWVTSETKWITAVMQRVTMTCSAESDELTSVAKILFFLIHLSRLCLRAVLPPQVRCKTVPSPFPRMGGITWVQRKFFYTSYNINCDINKTLISH